MRYILFFLMLCLFCIGRNANASAPTFDSQCDDFEGSEQVLEVLLKQIPSWYDRGESEEHRKARLKPIAEVLHCEARSMKEVAFTIAQGWHESRFDALVMSGQCRPGRCDPISGTPRARGPWQAWRAPNKWHDLWDWSINDVRYATRLQLEMGRAYACRGNVTHSFAAHGGGGCRSTEKAQARFRTYRKVLSQLHSVGYTDGIRLG